MLAGTKCHKLLCIDVPTGAVDEIPLPSGSPQEPFSERSLGPEAGQLSSLDGGERLPGAGGAPGPVGPGAAGAAMAGVVRGGGVYTLGLSPDGRHVVSGTGTPGECVLFRRKSSVGSIWNDRAARAADAAAAAAAAAADGEECDSTHSCTRRHCCGASASTSSAPSRLWDVRWGAGVSSADAEAEEEEEEVRSRLHRGAARWRSEPAAPPAPEASAASGSDLLGRLGLETVGLLRGHGDWAFGMAWLDADSFVTVSRDKSMALWKVPGRERRGGWLGSGGAEGWRSRAGGAGNDEPSSKRLRRGGEWTDSAQCSDDAMSGVASNSTIIENGEGRGIQDLLPEHVRHDFTDRVRAVSFESRSQSIATLESNGTLKLSDPRMSLTCTRIVQLLGDAPPPVAPLSSSAALSAHLSYGHRVWARDNRGWNGGDGVCVGSVSTLPFQVGLDGSSQPPPEIVGESQPAERGTGAAGAADRLPPVLGSPSLWDDGTDLAGAPFVPERRPADADADARVPPPRGRAAPQPGPSGASLWPVLDFGLDGASMTSPRPLDGLRADLPAGLPAALGPIQSFSALGGSPPRRRRLPARPRDGDGDVDGDSEASAVSEISNGSSAALRVRAFGGATPAAFPSVSSALESPHEGLPGPGAPPPANQRSGLASPAASPAASPPPPLVARPPPRELVCLAAGGDGLLFAGSSGGVHCVDPRSPGERGGCASLRLSHDRLGVRSLGAVGNLLTLGLGDGSVLGCDLRKLQLPPRVPVGALRPGLAPRGPSPILRTAHATSSGYLCCDERHWAFFPGVDAAPQAVHAHAWGGGPGNPALFVAGGPLPCGMRGSYAGVWS